MSIYLSTIVWILDKILSPGQEGEEVEVTHKQAEEQQHKVIHFGMELLMLREDT